MDIRDATLALIDVGRFLFSKGWVPATSGNLSVRLDDGTIMVTASGHHKGELSPEGLMQIDLDGRPIFGEGRPSAETPLHLMIYRRFQDARVVLHTHSALATILSMGGYDLTFEGFEMLKALSTIESHERRLRLPVFPNDQNVARLADRVAVHAGVTHGFMIAGHGLYTWGDSMATARRHVEAIEFLLECEQLRRTGTTSS
ncbi:MAG: methylthioribulose 1-phosphate dehydratase [Myxococcota bacterium]